MRRRIAKAVPHWHETQQAFLAQFGRAAWNSLATNLGDIVEDA
jgi:hypothetical protein